MFAERARPAAALCGAALLLAGCAGAPSLKCEVDLLEAERGIVAVACQVSGAPAGDCGIKQMAQDELVRVEGFAAQSAEGSVLAVTERPDAAMRSEARRFTERVLQLSGSRSFTYRYRVRPGAWMGDAMRGSQGRRLGYLDGRGGLLSGRNLFLLPSWYFSLSQIDVHFRLPERWTLAGTLPGEGSDRGLRGGGRAAADLVESVIGAGLFEERRAEMAGTNLRVFLRQDLPESLKAAAFDTARQGFGFLVSRLGPPQREYSLVLVPPPPDGSMILIPPSAAGQGEEISGTGPVQTYDLFYAMARAWTADPEPPLRFAPQDFWLKDALPAYYAVRTVEAVGSRPAKASWMMRAREARRESVALDGSPPRTDEALQARLAKGSFLLAITDAILTHEAQVGAGLDSVARSLAGAGGRRGFFDVIAEISKIDTQPLRDLANSERAIPVEWMGKVGIEPMPLSLEPSTAGRGAPGRRVHLLVTGNLHGMLEVCGCVARQLGGIARRETIRRRLLTQDPALALVELGDAYANDRAEPFLNEIGEKELALALGLMGQQRYASAAIGNIEMLRGPGFFQGMLRRNPLPYVNANLEVDGRPLAPPFRVTQAGPVRIAWVSALDPSWYAEANARFYEERLPGLRVREPIAALAEAARAARRQADLVVAIGSLPPALVRRILQEVPDVDAILSTEAADAALGGLLRFETDAEQTLMGFHGDRLVFFSTGDGRWMEEILLTLSSSGRIAGAELRHHALGEGVPDYPPFRARLSAFYDAMKQAPELAGAEEPVARHLPGFLKSEYAGAEVCRSCHAEQWAHWERTPHGSAFGTLVARHRNYAPRCVGCHVTGYGYPSGYRLGDPGEKLRHVQCEMCHGPGSLHAAAPSNLNIRRRPPRESCLECHNPQHSDMTEANFEDYYTRTAHLPPSPPPSIMDLPEQVHSH